MNQYFDLFEDGIDTVHRNWTGSSDVLDSEVLFATYTYEGYSGAAFLIYKRDGKLFEVHDAHCSCYGLENWEPEETSWAALAMRDNSGYGQDADKFLTDLIKNEGK